eukprot:TRINITY_DN1984_c0_g1_i2.p2 TRINITY_DN1984_c0_g1~~TRINITY_DN1984_c0_g1_i2.p2  ORF type:complete len:276 (+),score=48.92 TRINITY_DN1984_c0_g1_i2:469-1296(+)
MLFFLLFLLPASAKCGCRVDPLAFTHALLAGAQAQPGVECSVVYGSVADVQGPHKDGGYTVVVEGGSNLDADVVVLAMGPWTNRLLHAWIAHELPKSTPKQLMHPVRAHSIVLQPPPSVQLSPHAIFSDIQPSPEAAWMSPELYPRPNGHLYVCHAFDEDRGLPVSTPESANNPQPVLVARIQNALRVVCPALESAETQVVCTQTCFVPVSADNVPMIGQLASHRNLYVATAHGVWGILLAPATGLGIAELILHGKTSVELSGFEPRLERLVEPS